MVKTREQLIADLLCRCKVAGSKQSAAKVERKVEGKGGAKGGKKGLRMPPEHPSGEFWAQQKAALWKAVEKTPKKILKKVL